MLIISTIVIFILVVLFFLILSPFLGLIRNKRTNNLKNNHSGEANNYGNKKKNDSLANAFESNKEIWQYNIQKTINVPYFDYQENYNQFPFSSDYFETRNFLLKKHISNSKIEMLINKMENYESEIVRLWNKEQRRLLRYFDDVMIGISSESIAFVLHYYNLFLDAFRYETINFLNNKVLVAEIGLLLNENPKNIIGETVDFKQYICQALEEFNFYFIEHVDKIISDINQELNARFEDFIRQSQAFFRSNQTNGNYNQTNFEQSFDEVALAYEILNLSPQSSDEEIKKTYRKLAMKYHPDRNPNIEAKEKMTKINSAYDLIKKVRGMK